MHVVFLISSLLVGRMLYVGFVGFVLLLCFLLHSVFCMEKNCYVFRYNSYKVGTCFVWCSFNCYCVISDMNTFCFGIILFIIFSAWFCLLHFWLVMFFGISTFYFIVSSSLFIYAMFLFCFFFSFWSLCPDYIIYC